MKNANLLLLLVIISIFSACQSDDNDREALSNIVGTWRIQALELRSEYDFNGDGITSNNLLLETNCANGIYTFNNDGSGFYFVESLDIELIVDPSTNEAEYSIECIDNSAFSESFNWLKQGNSISLTVEEEQLIGTINDDTMTFLFDEEYIVEVFDGNEIIEVEEPVTMTLIKE